MSNKIEEEETTELDEALLDELSEALEVAINKVCERHSGKDPRLELLVTLGLSAAKTAYDSGYTKDEFLQLMDEMYTDIQDDLEGEVDKSMIN